MSLFTNKSIRYKQFDYLGHGKKLGKRKAISLVDIATDCFEEMQLDDQPFCFIGYSMGCLIAYEVIKQLKAQNASMPSHVYFISSNSPNEIDLIDFSKMNNEEFLNYIFTIQPISQELYENKDLLNYFLEITKSDFILISEYKQQQFLINKISCDGTVIYGREDLTIDSIKMEIWKDFFSRKCEIISIANESHFLSRNKLEEIILSAAKRDKYSMK